MIVSTFGYLLFQETLYILAILQSYLLRMCLGPLNGEPQMFRGSNTSSKGVWMYRGLKFFDYMQQGMTQFEIIFWGFDMICHFLNSCWQTTIFVGMI